jgi:hypothetical protein
VFLPEQGIWARKKFLSVQIPKEYVIHPNNYSKGQQAAKERERKATTCVAGIVTFSEFSLILYFL